MNAMTQTKALSLSRTHTAIYVADKMLIVMKTLILTYGLDPKKLADAWSGWVRDAARAWMESGHLTKFVIEFYRAGETEAQGRWDFPIRYDGTDIDQMWVDRDFLADTIGKVSRPPSECTYRVLLEHSPGAPDIGLQDVNYLQLKGRTAREAGTVIGTSDIFASVVYYK